MDTDFMLIDRPSVEIGPVPKNIGLSRLLRNLQREVEGQAGPGFYRLSYWLDRQHVRVVWSQGAAAWSFRYGVIEESDAGDRFVRLVPLVAWAPGTQGRIEAVRAVDADYRLRQVNAMLTQAGMTAIAP